MKVRKLWKLLFVLILAGPVAFAQHHHSPAKTTEEQLYSCPMHPEVISDKPGKCTECGMDLVRKEPAHVQRHTLPTGHQQDTLSSFPQFAVPVARPTPDSMYIPVNSISNLEADIETGAVEAATAGIHLQGGKTVRYDLFVTDTLVNYTGKSRKAIAVNGSLPAPTLVFTVGDTALIYVHNKAAGPTAVHWHGVFLPIRMDGVPHLTQHPVLPGTTHIYKFPVVQDGTYWYHSHFSLQEQIGLYGALIFNKREEPAVPVIPLVLSDWTDLKPEEVNRSLHAGTDWFSIKKKATQSYSEAIKAGKTGVKFTNEWKRMSAMDVSDVYYDRLLMNGAASDSVTGFKAGDQVRLRIVNGGASTYFWLTYSGGKMMVTANDGNDVEPVEVDRLIISPSETYDVVVTVPENRKYEFLATSEDRTRHASLWLGRGMEMPAAKLPRLQYFEGMKMMNGMMKMNGNMEPMGHAMSLQKMDMNRVMYPELQSRETEHGNHQMTGHSMKQEVYRCPMHAEVTSDTPGTCPKCGMELVKEEVTHTHEEQTGIITLNYDMLRAKEKTTLPDAPWKELRFELTGNMNRYVWTLDNKTVSESDKILIRKGENVRIILYNNSMMRHPMHLHGHDFRVVNRHGDYAPMKNVIDIMPMETDTLEFAASESGEWFFHCHILYHMMSGMGRIFSYQNSPPNPEIHDPEKAFRMLKMDDRMFFLAGQASLQSNGSDGLFTFSNTRWQVSQLWHLGYKNAHGYESETTVGRYIGKMQWFMPYAGFDYHYKALNPGEHNIFGDEEKNMFGQRSNKNNRKAAVVGFVYTLPWLVAADFRMDSDGKFRFQLGREDIPVTPRFRLNFMVNTDKEYTLGGRYIIGKYWSAGAHYDSDMGPGAGIVFTY